MEDIKTSKKNRFAKGSEEAKAYMAGLRAKRGNKGGGSNPPPPPPANCDCLPTVEKPKTKRNNKNIVVDF
jgi:heme-binding NEAT domain protein